MKQIGVSLEENIVDQLDAEASRRGLTRSQLARQAIEMFVEWKKVISPEGLIIALVDPDTEVEQV